MNTEEKTPNPEIEEEAEEGEQLVVFELADEEYGVSITDLKEIIDYPDVTPIPNSPEFIAGITDLRGEIIVVVDLKKRFNLKIESKHNEDKRRVIVAEVGDASFGIVVDRVVEILKAPKSSMKKTPELITGKIHADHLKGVSTLDERLILLLDISKVLDEKELLDLTDASKETQKPTLNNQPQNGENPDS